MIKDIIDGAAARGRVQDFCEAHSASGCIDILVRAISRHLDAIEAVRLVDSPNHHWARKGGPLNQSDRDHWEAVLAERDASAEYLAGVVAAHKDKP